IPSAPTERILKNAQVPRAPSSVPGNLREGRCRFGKGDSMRTSLAVLILGFVTAEPLFAHGLLIPKEKALPPLAMVRHRVTVAIEDQAAVTAVEQTFRNHTEQALEATYAFPVPRGAAVNGFTMWVDGKEVKGELVEAGRARSLYLESVRRTQD